jgi:hypothetical protein
MVTKLTHRRDPKQWPAPHPDETPAQMGRNGRAWMERDFSWSTIGREMSAVYRWLNGRGEKPSSVHTTSSGNSFD